MRTSLDFTGRLVNRFGTICAGMALSIVVFLILTVQVTLYFCRQPVRSRDPKWLKGFVSFIWILQALEIALSCHMTAISHGQDDHVLDEYFVKNYLSWEWGCYFVTWAVTDFLVHTLFIYRVYLLEKALFGFGISVILCFILLLEGSFGLFHALLYIHSEARHIDRVWSVPVWLGLSILADALIAGSFCYLLRKNNVPAGTGRLDLGIKRLIKFFVQTGLITSIVGGITLAFWGAAGLDPGHLLMSFPMSGVYATCLMTNLLARGSSYLWPVQVDEESTFILTGNISFANSEQLEKESQTGNISLHAVSILNTPTPLTISE